MLAKHTTLEHYENNHGICYRMTIATNDIYFVQFYLMNLLPGYIYRR